MHHSISDSEPSCQSDVLDYLNEIPTFGIKVQWDEALIQDTYFTNCTKCINKKGLCDYNSSDPSNNFICFHSKETISPNNFDSLIEKLELSISIRRRSHHRLPPQPPIPAKSLLPNHRASSDAPKSPFRRTARRRNHFRLAPTVLPPSPPQNRQKQPHILTAQPLSSVANNQRTHLTGFATFNHPLRNASSHCGRQAFVCCRTNLVKATVFRLVLFLIFNVG
ncbi:hypothetical protein KIW84_073755 [Lathyrus oleraceus]|uniref:Uncharacterized protein n=1 Tax=Pisum sativum TaxID=3888 RepID=A0A9D4VS86_PEA|nr:hypothetical protein KIW84_073755 [Pisum sativum]